MNDRSCTVVQYYYRAVDPKEQCCMLRNAKNCRTGHGHDSNRRKRYHVSLDLAGIILSLDERVDAESTVRQARKYTTTDSIEVAAETSRHTPVVACWSTERHRQSAMMSSQDHKTNDDLMLAPMYLGMMPCNAHVHVDHATQTRA